MCNTYIVLYVLLECSHDTSPFPQNVSPLVKSTVMCLLLMIMKRSHDVIEWYNDTKGNSKSTGNNITH